MIREHNGRCHVWSCTVIIGTRMQCDAHFLNHVVSLLLKCLVAFQWSSSELQYLLPCLIREKCKFVSYWFCGLASLDELEHWMCHHPRVNCAPSSLFLLYWPLKDCFRLYTLKVFKPVWKKRWVVANPWQKRVKCDILLISDKEAE